MPAQTFHGRDIFAPVAAHLASGRIPFVELGERVEFVAQSPVPRALESADGVEGEIVCIDHFGNLITNLDRQLLSGIRAKGVEIEGHVVPSRQ